MTRPGAARLLEGEDIAVDGYPDAAGIGHYDSDISRGVCKQGKEKRIQQVRISSKSLITSSGASWSCSASLGMNSIWGTTLPMRDVELGACSSSEWTEFRTVSPSRFNSGSDCWIFAMFTCNLQRQGN